MNKNKFQSNVKEWVRLSSEGQFLEAKSFYFDILFEDIINAFVERNAYSFSGIDVLFSILGYSPEPIILTRHVLKPQKHVIFYHNVGEDFEKQIKPFLVKFMGGEYTLVELKDLSFSTIYSTLKEQMVLLPATQYAIDITGGKKSMVASASIFARDYNFNVLYVDYDEYMPALRRPMPGSEILDLVYAPYRDLPDVRSLLDMARQ